MQLRMRHAPGRLMTLATQILACHQWQLETYGEAAYLVHRAEVGRPANFLGAVRRVLRDTAAAQWYATPWPRRAASNVLIVRRAACHLR